MQYVILYKENSFVVLIIFTLIKWYTGISHLRPATFRKSKTKYTLHLMFSTLLYLMGKIQARYKIFYSGHKHNIVDLVKLFLRQETSYKDDAESVIYILIHLISKDCILSRQRFVNEWKTQKQLIRWKSVNFFKEMVQILPVQLRFLGELYIIIKSLPRNQKPDYSKFIKISSSKIRERQNHLNKTLKQKTEKQYPEKNLLNQSSSENIKNTNNQQQNKMLKKCQKVKSLQENIQQEQIYLLVVQQDNQSDNFHEKIEKLQSTKCSFKIKGFENKKVQNEQ